MSYSKELIEEILGRIFQNEISIREAAKYYGVSRPCIIKWKQFYLHKTTTGPQPKSNKKTKAMTQIQLPKGVTYLAAHKAVILKNALSPEEFGKYCREQGLLSSEVEQWEKWFISHPNAVAEESLVQSEKRLSDAQKQIKIKEKELALKDKALANTATMLMLSKKAQAIWDKKED